MPKPQRDPVREQFWRETIADWRASGRTIRDFCDERHLSRTAFDHWQRELKRRDQPVPPTPKSSKASAKSPPRSAPRSAPRVVRPAFVPVTVVPTPRAPGPTVAVEVRCPTGHVVSVTGVPLGETLRDLFAALGSATDASTEGVAC